MRGPYPEESQRLDVIGHLEELRRRMIICLAVFLLATILLFAMGDDVMSLVKKPLDGLAPKLIFITPTEAFVSYVKVALLAGFVVSFPIILYELWAFLSPAVPARVRSHVLVWSLMALALFAAGILFSYLVVMPAALRFLLNFGMGVAVPNISLGRYVSFFGSLILIGGFVFEIPIAIGLLTDIGVLRSQVLRKNRRYAIVIILITAAVITPTQDIVNMLLFAVPMALLYEAGVIIARIIEARRKG